MDDDEFPRTGEDVLRQVLAALAPAELPSVAGVLRAYREKPWTPDGAGPAAWAPFVLAFVAGTVVGAAPAGRGRPAPAGLDVPVPAFDHDQLRRAWAAAVDAATGRGCARPDREAFAAAVVAVLSAGPAPRPR